MSSAKARCSSSSIIALPPYLTTTTLPWNSSQPRQRVGQDGDLGASPSGSFTRMTRRVPTFRQPARRGGSSIRDVGRGGVRASGAHVEYAEFSCT